MMFALQFKASSAFRFMLSCLDTLVWTAARRARHSLCGAFLLPTTARQAFNDKITSLRLWILYELPPACPLNRNLVACNYVNYYAAWARSMNRKLIFPSRQTFNNLSQLGFVLLFRPPVSFGFLINSQSLEIKLIFFALTPRPSSSRAEWFSFH